MIPLLVQVSWWTPEPCQHGTALEGSPPHFNRPRDNLRLRAAEGYVYGVIGAVGPIDFYAGSVGAAVIENSTPGIYGAQLESG